MAGAEPWSFVADDSTSGALVLHGFTGNPGSMRGLAEALAADGSHVELPLLAGHGTAMEDMLDTTWADWTASVDAAYERLRQRCDRIVVAGLSMGGTLALWVAARRPDVCALICINPATQPQPDELLVGAQAMLDGGTIVIPGIGSDIADPDVTENSYPGTPLPCLISFAKDGLATLHNDFATMTMPLLLMTSPQDHVVDPVQSDFLAANYGGPVTRISLQRSYHVATQDYDRELIFAESVAFAAKMCR